MYTEAEYKEALQRLCILMLQDPEPDSADGRELNSLADLVMEYESEHYPDSFKRTCDFCNKFCAPEQIDPEEGDLWACHECQDRWAKEDGGVREF